MATKITGRDWNEFYTNEEIWPKGGYLDELCLTIDGEKWSYEDGHNNLDDLDLEKLPDHAIVQIDYGYIDFDTKLEQKAIPIVTVIKKFLKERDTQRFVIEVSKDSADQIKAEIREMGIKIL